MIDKTQAGTVINKNMAMNIIEGEKVVLRPIRPGAELELMRVWRNEPENFRLFFTDHKISPDEHLRWFENISKQKYKGVYTIAEKATDEPAGTINYGVDATDKSVTFGIMIGPNKFRRKGFGGEAEDLLLKKLTSEFGVTEAIMEVFITNKAAISFYEKRGYKTTETLSNTYTQDGKPCDVLVMKKSL